MLTTPGEEFEKDVKRLLNSVRYKDKITMTDYIDTCFAISWEGVSRFKAYS